MLPTNNRFSLQKRERERELWRDQLERTRIKSAQQEILWWVTDDLHNPILLVVLRSHRFLESRKLDDLSCSTRTQQRTTIRLHYFPTRTRCTCTCIKRRHLAAMLGLWLMPPSCWLHVLPIVLRIHHTRLSTRSLQLRILSLTMPVLPTGSSFYIRGSTTPHGHGGSCLFLIISTYKSFSLPTKIGNWKNLPS